MGRGYKSKVQIVVDAGIAHTNLYIYVHNQRVIHLENPASSSVLDWLARLNRENVTKLVLMTQDGWLTIDPYDDDLNICFCDNNLDIRDCEIVSRQAAAEKILQFLEDKAW